MSRESGSVAVASVRRMHCLAARAWQKLLRTTALRLKAACCMLEWMEDRIDGSPAKNRVVTLCHGYFDIV